ncbi:hypothetical protein [Maridesulfovibrio sp.]|uniref:hypothetical protein n=1 Tax=Maridesulfovibrio sp. TaxID=2795000 RepID=UPI002AA8CFA9|nr:hypothetical protein [Maridesulfovibrio sp.]
MIIKVKGVYVEFKAADTPQNGNELIKALEEHVEQEKAKKAMLHAAEKAAMTLAYVAKSFGADVAVSIEDVGPESKVVAGAVECGIMTACLMADLEAGRL